MVRWFYSLVVVCLAASQLRAADPVDYLRDIAPILRERCYACHGALKQKSKLRLDTAARILAGGTSGPAIKPHDTTASLLIERVSDPDESSRMPPEGKPLTASQIGLLKAWIEAGAKAPADEKSEADPSKHWAFVKPLRPDLPLVAHAKGNCTAIDRFIAAEHAKRGLQPAPETDRATLLRRVYLDLTGLPPSREAIHAFLSDSAPDAYERVVEQLLASPAYGERWGRHWMDVWRYSDWYGRRLLPDVLNSYGQIWRWRDWIVHSLNSDRGYDEMVRLMLAADELTPTNEADLVATGFLVRNFFRWNYNNWLRDNVEHTGKAFLGLTLNCCHCHDHKYDPITQEEYFRFRAVFEPIEIRHDAWPGEPNPGPYPKYSYGAAYAPITSGAVRVMDEKVDAKTYLYTGGDERNVVKDRPAVPPGVPAALGGFFRVEAVNLPAESWYPGITATIRTEEMGKRTAAVRAAQEALAKARTTKDADGERVAEARVEAARSDRIALEARIAADDATYRGTGNATLAAEAASRAERQSTLDAAWLAEVQADVALGAVQKAKNAAAIPPAEKQLADAGSRVEAARKLLQARSTTYTPLSPVYPKTSSGRRSALAKWIANRDNPLTARVAVNHIWAWHFGRPLVDTTFNFGRSGKAPSHPELLDWLAVELMEQNWRIKPIHRLIVLSQAYRMQSKSPSAAANAKIDPDNRFLWRFPTNRMEAEVVRDSLLAVAGELDPTIGGPEIPQERGQSCRRRSLYFAHHGEARMEFLDLFDAANPCDAYRRTSSVLPQQALALANSNLAQQLGRIAAKKLSSSAMPDGEFIRTAFEQVLGRPPREAEAFAAAKFLAQQRELFAAKAAELKTAAPLPDGPSADAAVRAHENLLQALFSHTDFVTIR